ncbi:kinase-like domain-containing protein [Rhizophagus irregularis DAOM 181602=DAOM 197198]|nr:kinase-like domain-containing protein [Rhizophagus irregularis DAOM 181602=DAOM 197198]
MEEFKLSDDVIEQIKDFKYYGLTKEQTIWKDGFIDSLDFELNQWKRSKYWCGSHKNFPVILKCLHNSQDITAEFLREIELYTVCSGPIILCHGITKDPKSNNFMMVIPYAKNGSLRQHLNKSFNSIDWDEKLYIYKGLQKALRDYRKRIYSRNICQGLRPKSDYKVPQLILDISKRCWDAGPLKRPKANELCDMLVILRDELKNISCEITVYTSRFLDFKNLPEPKNAIDNGIGHNSFGEYSESIEAMDFTKLNLDKTTE